MRATLFIVSLLCISPLSQSTFAAQEESGRVLVFGGSGRLGSDVVKALVSDGHSVTVFVRPTSNRSRLDGYSVEYVTGDVLDSASVSAAMKGAAFDVVIDALGRSGADVEFFRTSAANIAASAMESSVRQIILHGSVGAGESSKAYADRQFSERMRKLMVEKTAGENAVIGSGVPYTIIRNSSLLRYETPESGNAELYEDQTLTGRVTRLGLARLTAGCVLNELCYDKIYHAVDKTLN